MNQPQITPLRREDKAGNRHTDARHQDNRGHNRRRKRPRFLADNRQQHSPADDEKGQQSAKFEREPFCEDARGIGDALCIRRRFLLRAGTFDQPIDPIFRREARADSDGNGEEDPPAFPLAEFFAETGKGPRLMAEYPGQLRHCPADRPPEADGPFLNRLPEGKPGFLPGGDFLRIGIKPVEQHIAHFIIGEPRDHFPHR